jgi:hypothetical protein
VDSKTTFQRGFVPKVGVKEHTHYKGREMCRNAQMEMRVPE